MKVGFIFIHGSLGSTLLLLINSEAFSMNSLSLCYEKGGVTLIVLFKIMNYYLCRG